MDESSRINLAFPLPPIYNRTWNRFSGYGAIDHENILLMLAALRILSTGCAAAQAANTQKEYAMELKVLDEAFTICKIENEAQIDFTAPCCFVGKTDQELSLVCPTDYVPAAALEREDGWRAFRIEGILDFSLVGILSAISSVLAENHIGIFAVSTFNTDYILMKSENFDRGLAFLEENGYTIVR